MKRFSLPVLIVGLTLVISLQAAELMGWLPDLLRPAVDQPLAEMPEDLLCGPKSLHVATNLLGHPADFERIMENCPVTDRGVVFADLKTIADSLGLTAKFRSLGWADLIEEGCVAILYVDNGHYVTVDARARDAVRLYDPGRVARVVAEVDIDKRWLGEALVLIAPASNGVPVHFKSLWNDDGYVYGRSHTSTAQLENRSNVPIKLRIADIGCSCTKARIIPDTIAPGESASLITEIDLTGKRGPFAEKVVVGSNTSDELYVVWFCGGKLSEALCRAEHFLGEYVDGASLQHVIYIHDPGENLLDLNDSDVFVDVAVAGHEVQISATLETVEEDDSDLGQREMFPVRPGDYRVRLKGVLPKLKGAGDILGSMQVVTKLPPPLDVVTMKLTGRVVSSVNVIPHALLLDDTTSTQTTTLKLRSRNGQSRVRLIGFRSTIDGLSITPSSSDEAEVSVEVVIPAGSVAPGHRSHIYLNTNEGELPVLVTCNDR